MYRGLSFLALGMLFIVSSFACTRSDQGELAKARAEAQAAKAEAAKARAEADDLRAGRGSPPASKTENQLNMPSIEATDSTGTVTKVRNVRLGGFGATYVVGGTESIVDYGGLTFVVGESRTKIPWKSISTVELDGTMKENDYQILGASVRLSSGETKKMYLLATMSLVGDAENGKFSLELTKLRKLVVLPAE